MFISLQRSRLWFDNFWFDNPDDKNDIIKIIEKFHDFTICEWTPQKDESIWGYTIFQRKRKPSVIVCETKIAQNATERKFNPQKCRKREEMIPRRAAIVSSMGVTPAPYPQFSARVLVSGSLISFSLNSYHVGFWDWCEDATEQKPRVDFTRFTSPQV